MIHTVRLIPLQKHPTPGNDGGAGFWKWPTWAGSLGIAPPTSSPACGGSTVADQTPRFPDWSGIAPQLSMALGTIDLETTGPRTAHALIGPPGSGIKELVVAWAHEHDALIVPSPTADEILRSTDWWHAFRDQPGRMLAVPELEHCFLRHHDGLTGLRQFMEWHWSHPRPLLVGCDSWAWAYLRRSLHLDAIFRQPLTVAPSDGPALKRWFQPLWPTSRSAPPDDYWLSLARISLGIPGVAWSLARRNLNTSVSAENETSAALDVEQPIRCTMPGMPPPRGSLEAMVLHVLLLHAGLPSRTLLELLPFPAAKIMAAVAWLHDHGLLDAWHDRWHVCPGAYPCVREFLGNEGFLVDDL